MSTNLTFTATSEGIEVTGGIDLGYVSIPVTPDKYQLIQKTATELWFRPVGGAWDFGAFTYADVASPLPGNLAALKAALTTMLSNSSSDMTPTGIAYVSQVYGNDFTGNGSLELPYQTIAKGIEVTDDKTTTDGIQWGVDVLPGNYDEQIVANATNSNPVFITLHEGASVASTTVVTVSDAVANVSITLHKGSRLFNGAAVPTVDVSNGFDVEIYDLGSQFFTTTNTVLVDVSNGNFRMDGGTLVRQGGTGEVFNVSGGVARLTNTGIFQSDTSSAIVKSGGDMKLSYVRIQTAHTDYASAGSAQDIQIVDCACNVTFGANITETVGTMLVNAAFTL